MRVSAIRRVVVLLALVVLLGVTSQITIAQETPVNEATPVPRANLPQEFCTPEEMQAGLDNIVERPQGGALVMPFATPGRDLYLLEITLPPDSCVAYDSHYLHNGAISWFVQSGEIEFATQPIAGLPAPTIAAWDGNDMPIAGISATPKTLGSGAWVTLDRAAEYSYRNTGSEPAVVLMAVNEEDPFGGAQRSCKGGCRKR